MNTEQRRNEQAVRPEAPSIRDIKLLSEGSVAIFLYGNYLRLSAADRAFVNGLVELFDTYLEAALPEAKK